MREFAGDMGFGRWSGPLKEMGSARTTKNIRLVGLTEQEMYILTAPFGRPDRFDLAPLAEALKVGDSKVLAECLDKHSSVTADALISNELARCDVDVNSYFLCGNACGCVNTQAPDEQRNAPIQPVLHSNLAKK
jgi:hypothetical protein